MVVWNQTKKISEEQRKQKFQYLFWAAVSYIQWDDFTCQESALWKQQFGFFHTCVKVLNLVIAAEFHFEC